MVNRTSHPRRRPRCSRRIPICTALLVALAWHAPVPHAGAEESAAEEGDPHQPTSFGQFTGTWYRFEPEHEIAVLIRDEDDADARALRLIWRLESGLQLDTGWDGRAEYSLGRVSGNLTLSIDEERSDDDRILLDWTRNHRIEGGSTLVETGEVEIFRVGVGYSMAWKQTLDRERRQPVTGSEEPRITTSSTSVKWIFNFQSKRMLLWDEIYW